MVWRFSMRDIKRIQPKNKDDVFNKNRAYNKVYSRLLDGSLLMISDNNKIVREYINAKIRGNNRSVLYSVYEPEKTLEKNMLVFKLLERLLNKSFQSLTETDIDNLQMKLNGNDLFTTNKYIKRKPLSYSYRLDIVRVLKQFWRFYRVYSKFELGKEIPDITEFLRIRKPKNQNILVSFITKDEIDNLINNAMSYQMRAFIALHFETGARVVEILKLRNQNCSYNENKRVWIIKLPQEKGHSSGKMPIELTFSNNHFSKWMQLSKNKMAEDYVFGYSYEYVRKFYRISGKEVLGRHLTPKIMRKSTTMYLINSNANEQYIRAHMGWAPSSSAITHYINQKAIERPDSLKAAIQKDFYSDVTKENEELKLKQKIQADQLERMMNELKEMKQQKLNEHQSINTIDAASSQLILKAVFDHMLSIRQNERNGQDTITLSKDRIQSIKVLHE